MSTREKEYEAQDTSAEDQIEPLMDGSQRDTSSGVQSQSSKSYGRNSRLLILSTPLLATCMIIALLLGALVAGLIPRSFQHSMSLMPMQHQHSKVLVKPCGSSAAEARQKGCHFDIISFCWLPSQCYDGELSQDFDNTVHLEWFLDPNRTQPLSHEQIMTGEYTDLYVNWEYHLRHCTAMWKKMHRAIMGSLGNRAIDGYIGSYEHTKHCEHMLLGDRGTDLETINTIIQVKYPDCGI